MASLNDVRTIDLASIIVFNGPYNFSVTAEQSNTESDMAAARLLRVSAIQHIRILQLNNSKLPYG